MNDLHTERMIQRGRVVGLVFAAGLVLSFGPDRSSLVTLAVLVLAVSVLVSWLGMRRAEQPRALRSLGVVTFVADVVVVGLLLAAVSQDPIDPVGFVTYLIGVEAALKWGRKGALLGGLLAGVLAVAWAAAGYEAIGRELPATSIAFRLLSNVVLALPVGLLVEHLRTEQSYARRLFEASNEAILVVADGCIIDANAVAVELANRSPGQLLDHPIDEVFDLHGPWVNATGTTPSAVGAQGRGSIVDASGQRRWLSFDTVVDDDELRILIVRDVTAQVERTRQLEAQALIDPVTGLHNRSALRASLADHLPANDLGLVFLDLDGFKAVNDEHGHTIGDELLRAVAQRLRSVTRAQDVAYRWAGDEFCLVVHPATPQILTSMAIRIEQVLRDPIDLGAVMLTAHASVGTAMAQSEDDEASLIHRADSEMYQRKARYKQRLTP